MAVLPHCRWRCIWHPSLQAPSCQVPSLWHIQVYTPGQCQRWSVPPASTCPLRLTHLKLLVVAMPGTYWVAKEDSLTDQLSQDLLHGVEQWHTQTQAPRFSYNTVRWEKYFLEKNQAVSRLHKKLVVKPQLDTSQRVCRVSSASIGYPFSLPQIAAKWQHSEMKVFSTPVPWYHPNWSPQRSGNAFLNLCFMKELTISYYLLQSPTMQHGRRAQKMQPKQD